MNRHRRPSLRHGLPYRWWRTEGFWAGTVSLFSLIVLIAMLVFLLLLWFLEVE